MFGIIKKNVYYVVFEKKHGCWTFAPIGAMPHVTYPGCNVAIYCNSTEAVSG